MPNTLQALESEPTSRTAAPPRLHVRAGRLRVAVYSLGVLLGGCLPLPGGCSPPPTMEPGRRYPDPCDAGLQHVCRGECVVGPMPIGTPCGVDPCAGPMPGTSAEPVRGACGAGMMCVAMANGQYNEGRCLAVPAATSLGELGSVTVCDPDVTRGAAGNGGYGNLCSDWSLCVRLGTSADWLAGRACLAGPNAPGLCRRAAIDGEACDSTWSWSLAHAADRPVTACMPCAPGLDCLDGVCRRQCDSQDPTGGLCECPNVPSGTTSWRYICDTAPHSDGPGTPALSVLVASCTPAAMHLQTCPALTLNSRYDAQRVSTERLVSALLPGGSLVTYDQGAGTTGLSRGLCVARSDVCYNGHCCTAPTQACQADADCCTARGIAAPTCVRGQCCMPPLTPSPCATNEQCCSIRPADLGIALPWPFDSNSTFQVCCNDAALNDMTRRILCAGQATNRCGPVPCGYEGAPCCLWPVPECQSGLACAAGENVCRRCGGKDQPCCASGPQCSGVLTCEQGTCRQTCGVSGLPCCGRTQTGGRWTGTCIDSECDETSGLCGPCGLAGQSCCGSGGSQSGTCNSFSYCTSCSTHPLLGCCASCGSVGARCCPASAPSPCLSGAQCGSSGWCEECGRSIDGPCCPDHSCPTTDINQARVCVADTCQYCGWVGQFCCVGGSCAGGIAACNFATNRCESCGGLGQLCCDGVSPCGSGLVCDGGRCGPPCGQTGQPCCSGRLCTTMDVCDASNICVQSCGRSGEPCCVGRVCTNATDACDAANVCSACGGPGQPCCANKRCNAGSGCFADVCQSCGTNGLRCCPATAPATAAECFEAGTACDLASLTCKPCGYPSAPCCGSSCDSWQAQCNATTQRCEACGTSTGLPCCAGACDDGLPLVCDSATSTCRDCGAPGQMCCVGGRCQQVNMSVAGCNPATNRCECGFATGPCCATSPPCAYDSVLGRQLMCNYGTCF